jgi:hypothetical protein
LPRQHPTVLVVVRAVARRDGTGSPGCATPRDRVATPGSSHVLSPLGRWRTLCRARSPGMRWAGRRKSCGCSGGKLTWTSERSMVASVLMGHASPDLQPAAAPITLARYTRTLPDTMEHARASNWTRSWPGLLLRRRTEAAAEIHSPLHSPGTQAPVLMRRSGRFGAVSKTVDGRKVVRGFESLPLRSTPARDRPAFPRARCE